MKAMILQMKAIEDVHEQGIAGVALIDSATSAGLLR
jgi:hypothetical protein